MIKKILLVSLFSLNLASVLDFEKFDEELEKINSSAQIAEGKDVILFVGPTGSGKTTLTAIATEEKVQLDQFDQFVLENPKNEGLKISSRSHSVTSEAYGVETKIGFIIDIPGLYDTHGTISQVMNAALIQRISECAKSLKLLMLMTESDFGQRAQSFNKNLELSRSVMSEYIEKDSFGLIFNQIQEGEVQSRLSADQIQLDFVNHYCDPEESKENNLLLRSIVESNRFITIKKATSNLNVEDFTKQCREQLDSLQGRLAGCKGKISDLTLLLTPESQRDVETFFLENMRKNFSQIASEWLSYPATSPQKFDNNKEKIKDQVKKLTVKHGPLVFLSSVLHTLFEKVWTSFQGEEFKRTFENHHLSLKHQEETEKNRLEAERVAEAKRKADEQRRQQEENRRRLEQLRLQQRENGPLDDENSSLSYYHDDEKKFEIAFYPDTIGGDNSNCLTNAMFVREHCNVVEGKKIIGVKGEFDPKVLWRKYRMVMKYN